VIKRIVAVLVALGFAGALLPGTVLAEKSENDKKAAAYREQVRAEVPKVIADFKKADPSIERFFKDSIAYVVFPRVGKAGFIIGGGSGDGEVYEKGKLIGLASISFGTIGLQAGAQEYSQILFFKDPAALANFKQNHFEFAANASAVIIKAGAGGTTDYSSGVATFVKPLGGAMAEAAIGSQKFNFKPESAPAKKK
jgi:lipid-binding SYLF domain-containing protein